MLTENAKKKGLLKAGAGAGGAGGGGFKPQQRRFKMKAMMNCHNRIVKLEEVLDRLETRRDIQLERIQELQRKKEMKRKEEVQIKLQERIEKIQQRSEFVKERIENVEQRLANQIRRFHCLQDQLLSSWSSSNEESFQEQVTPNAGTDANGEEAVTVGGGGLGVDDDLATAFGTVVDISEQNSFKDMKRQVKMARKSMNQDGIKKHDMVSVQITPDRIVRKAGFQGVGGADAAVVPGTAVVVMTKKQLLMRMRNQMKQVRKARRQALNREKRQLKMEMRQLKIN